MSSRQARTKIVGITDEMTALGLNLAGIKEIYSIKEGNGQEKLIELVNRENVAVLIITERLADLNRMILNRVTRRPWPVVVEIPGPEGHSDRETSTLRELVKSALGIDIEI